MCKNGFSPAGPDPQDDRDIAIPLQMPSQAALPATIIVSNRAIQLQDAPAGFRWDQLDSQGQLDDNTGHVRVDHDVTFQLQPIGNN